MLPAHGGLLREPVLFPGRLWGLRGQYLLAKKLG
jgi:hypothetical protein